jgi:SAM-dependent methyltransferase
MTDKNSPGFADAAATWDKRFAASADYLFGRAPNEYLRAQGPRFAPGGRVLCVADGEGRNSVWLAQQGLQVQAFDIAGKGVDKARALAREAGVQVDFHVAGCDDWVWAEAAFDTVAAIFVQFADPAMRARLFDGMVRTLRPGGLLVLQGYTPKQLDYKTGGPGVLSHLYTAELLREAFDTPRTEIVELTEYEAELREGTQHAGRSALIGMVARRR